jgi:hypothetical protein
MKARIVYILCSLWVLVAPGAFGEEFKLELSEIEKKPYHVGGYLEFRPILNVLDQNAYLYKLKFYNRAEGKTTEEYNFKALVEGSYEKDNARLFVRFNYDLNHTDEGWSDAGKLYEGYLSLKPSSSFSADLGKRTLKWGKGYAWNPVAFIDRRKDPDEPDLALEGFWVGSADYIKSFQGPIQTFSFTPVVLPVSAKVNDDFSSAEGINVAGKLYFLIYDTDIDLIAFTGGSRTTRYGIDFSRNLSTNFEIHGEFAYIEDFQKKLVDANGNVNSKDYDAISYLLGIRYLAPTDTTFIFEYYHDGTGYTKNEIRDFYHFVDKGYSQYLFSGNGSLLKKASNVMAGGYGRPNPMTDYLYLRVSQKEPFEILYFTPALTSILNLKDQSLSISPELLYTGVTNLDLRLKAMFLVGQGNTEFGEKPNLFRVEFRLRYYF